MLTILAFSFGYLLALLAVRVFLPSVWAMRVVRRAFLALLVVGVLGWILRSVGIGSFRNPGTTQASPVVARIGATLLGGATVVSLALFLSSPVAAILRLVATLLARIGRPTSASAPPAQVHAPVDAADGASPPPVASGRIEITSPEVDVGRRRFVTAATLAVPGVALAAAGIGSASAFRSQILPEREAWVTGLAPEFEGLRVLQITDLHLGVYASVEDVEALMTRAEALRPDLVVLTGDFSDHLPWVLPSLALISQMKAPLGVAAVLGNHEYYRGVKENTRAYERAGIDLLFDESRGFRRGHAELRIVGVDDPGRSKQPGHYTTQAELALRDVPSDAFTLGLCHRPEGFDALAAHRVGLTLSGHTHGAQMGVGDHSVLEPAMPAQYLRGFYKKNDSVLYTSSGAGHWFPFRLNCPSEAPLLVLRNRTA